MRVRMTRTIETTSEDGSPVRYPKGSPWTFSAEKAQQLLDAGDAERDTEFEAAELVLIENQAREAAEAAASPSTPDIAPGARRARRSFPET